MSELVPIKTYTIPEYGITVRVFNGGNGEIVSELKDQFVDGNEREMVVAGILEPDREALAMVDAIEALILGHACSGIDIESKAYLTGLRSALDACANHL
jgi:hypothetical protein